jgi:hypothetical protein
LLEIRGYVRAFIHDETLQRSAVHQKGGRAKIALTPFLSSGSRRRAASARPSRGWKAS